ncbi:hypothetical protein Leryth_022843 [Lithospermum erythrorhizon]|nr:hypothetical protein Leryth_022843 [Lithospermum erythrorhizon]
MDSKWWEKKLYPLSGIFTIFFLLYLSFNDQINFSFPTVLWLPKMGFVGVNDTSFVIKNENQSEFYVNGWNSYWLMDESVWGSSRSVSEMFKRGASMGLSVCRTWAFNDGTGSNALQLRPGIFNERVFKGLDYVIVEARKHKIRLILSLVNNLPAFGGKSQYVRWADEAGTYGFSSNDSFFSHPVIKVYYKEYVKAIVSRKNSLSGIRYSDEPAIFAWELINEPRCELISSAPALQAWITEMAAYVKSLDKKHLVTVGLEGFYGLKSTQNSEANPGQWAASLGSDFIDNSAITNLDFASVHAYPDSWIPEADLVAKLKYLSHWMDAHINDADNVLKKPVLFTEVGSHLITNHGEQYQIDAILKTVYDKVYESAKKKGAGAGALIWQLLVEGAERYTDRFAFVAWKHPSTHKLIVDQSCRLRELYPHGLPNKRLHPSDICYYSNRS